MCILREKGESNGWHKLVHKDPCALLFLPFKQLKQRFCLCVLNLHQQRKQNNTLKICFGSPTDNSVRHHERECLGQILVRASKVLLARTFTEVIDKVKRSWFDWLIHIFHLRHTAFMMHGNANAVFSRYYRLVGNM